MPATPTIAVVLPCVTQIDSLEVTLHSLAAQAGAFRLQCHVVATTTDPELSRALDWWQRQFADMRQPVECESLVFSHQNSPNAPLGTCLIQGFDHCSKAEILGWMLPGDQVLPGALLTVADALQRFSPQHLSWLSCATAAPLPAAALRVGLCDGHHWEALPAVGTFFRPWLWKKSAQDPALQTQDLAAATQALWRGFSRNAGLTQTSSIQATTAQPVPAAPTPEEAETRRQALSDLAAAVTEGAPLVSKQLSRDSAQDDLVIHEIDARPSLALICEQVLGQPLSLPDISAPVELHRAPQPVELPPLEEVIRFQGNILAYDADWQYPAITEQHAFQQLSSLGAVPQGVTYVAYPWATLIDKLHRKTADLQEHLDRFRAFCDRLPPDTLKVTTCQHIKMKEELDLFHQAGISEIFWPHTTHDDVAAGVQDGLRLHPFPLFPVQAVDEDGPEDSAATDTRPHLFSFIGARANQHYLTGSRNWILDLLGDDPRGQIIGRTSWHYNKVVYDHQVQNPSARKEAAQNFIDTSASDQFRASLRAAVFSLCPSGTGPNSIRLWESLGLGAIPVILADSWAPPGNGDLWQAGAVFCAETPEAIRALPDRLEALAADREALARLRHAGRQLWALYGPHGFIYDLQKFMLEAADGLVCLPRAPEGAPLSMRLADALMTGPADDRQTAALYVSSLSGQLLLEGDTALITHQSDPLARQAEARARQILEPDHRLLGQLDRTLALLQQRITRQQSPALLSERRRPIRVCLMGKHANRTPLAYAPFQKLAADRITLVQAPQLADVVLTGFNSDLRDIGADLLAARRDNPQLQTVILSEEPLWDSIWSGALMPRQRQIELADGALDYHVFNHSNTEIFDFDSIPYFLLTRSDFQARYGILLARHTHLSPQALLQHWQAAPIPAAFYAEVRNAPAYSKSWPEQEVTGLSVYRTEVARSVDLPGTLREGKGWRPDAKRQALPDWHLDKLAALDMRCRVVSAYENTHQAAYISEKIFDAFLVGGIPTYYASPNHRIHALVPEAAMINTHGQDARSAAQRIATFTPDLNCAEAWLDTAHRLQARFSDLDAIARERRRITDAVVSALRSCLQ